MGKGIKEPAGAHELEPVSLSELIHHHVRAAIGSRPRGTAGRPRSDALPVCSPARPDRPRCG
jgi:hypothetical protein